MKHQLTYFEECPEITISDKYAVPKKPHLFLAIADSDHNVISFHAKVLPENWDCGDSVEWVENMVVRVYDRELANLAHEVLEYAPADAFRLNGDTYRKDRIIALGISEGGFFQSPEVSSFWGYFQK